MTWRPRFLTSDLGMLQSCWQSKTETLNVIYTVTKLVIKKSCLWLEVKHSGTHIIIQQDEIISFERLVWTRCVRYRRPHSCYSNFYFPRGPRSVQRRQLIEHVYSDSETNDKSLRTLKNYTTYSQRNYCYLLNSENEKQKQS